MNSGPEHHGRGEVDEAAHAGEVRQQRHDHEQDRVQQDVQARELDAVGHRQHRDAGARVIVAPRDGERPEVRRGPDEDDQEQQQRMRVDAAGDCGPAEHRRRGAGGTADHDVLRRDVLEPHRVEDRVADQRGEREHRRQRVDERPQHQHRQRADHRGIGERLAGRHQAGRDRPAHGARHLLVVAPVEHVVDGRGARGREPDAERAADQRCERRQPRHGEEHADHRREDDQCDHLRLAELEVITPGRGPGGGEM